MDFMINTNVFYNYFSNNQSFINKNVHRKSQNPTKIAIKIWVGGRRIKNTLLPNLIPTKYTKKFLKIGRAVSEECYHKHRDTRFLYISLLNIIILK